MDLELLDAHFKALSEGEEIIVPKFEFARQMRNDSRGRRCTLKRTRSPFLRASTPQRSDFRPPPEATGIYISARSDVLEGEQLRFKRTWMRLTRRAVRDFNFRGTGICDTMEMWANVRRGEKLYISPFKYRANIIIDSSLPYEVSVMKNYAQPMLEAVPEDNQRRAEMLDLIRAFDYFEPVDPKAVPGCSLLREFIGGGCYTY
jgi:uridine kinase